LYAPPSLLRSDFFRGLIMKPLDLDQQYDKPVEPQTSKSGGQMITDEVFVSMLKKHTNHIAALLLRTPRVWGDPKRIKSQANVALNDLLINTRSGDVYIGKDCFFGHGCALLTGSHDPDLIGQERLTAVPDSGHDIVVEDGVWLASFVTVIGPAVLKKNSVVAAGSLVLGDTEEGCLYAGRPAKLVRRLRCE